MSSDTSIHAGPAGVAVTGAAPQTDGTPDTPVDKRFTLQRRRRIVLPLVLFIATCASMFVAYAEVKPVFPHRSEQRVIVLGKYIVWYSGQVVYSINWLNPLIYMGAGIAVLLSHEMGHFLQAVRYRVPASLPFFIPFPLSPIGTMGAVIGMRGSVANRKQMFDIGLTGPLAGLLVALPITWIGIRDAAPSLRTIDEALQQDGFVLNAPLIFQLLIDYLHPRMSSYIAFNESPLCMAGWMAMLITGLNMLPVSQLDGGHVAYALFGRHAHLLARMIVLFAAIYIIVARQYGWSLMLLLILFVIGTDHPPTADDGVPMGWWRRILGLASLAIPVFCLAPVPILLPN